MMQIKLERSVTEHFSHQNFHCNDLNGWESGECSEEECEIPTKIRKINKRKKKHKRKRRRSSSNSTIDLTLPSSDPYQFELDNEDDGREISDKEIVNENDADNIMEEEIKSNNTTEIDNITSDKVECKLLDMIDITGLDKVEDCRILLKSKGFSYGVINKLYMLLENMIELDIDEEDEEEEEESCEYKEQMDIVPVESVVYPAEAKLNDEEDDYDSKLMNELPVIPSSSLLCPASLNNYSPEHADTIIQPYDSLPSYAPSISSIVDSIPKEISPRDPRFSNSHNKVTKLPPLRSLPIPAVVNDAHPVSKEIASINWEANVAEIVKLHLKPFLHNSLISREEYKSIMKRAVVKIVNSGDRKLETDKISNFVQSYVTMTQKARP